MTSDQLTKAVRAAGCVMAIYDEPKTADEHKTFTSLNVWQSGERNLLTEQQALVAGRRKGFYGLFARGASA